MEAALEYLFVADIGGTFTRLCIYVKNDKLFSEIIPTNKRAPLVPLLQKFLDTFKVSNGLPSD
jgi:glucokinase